MNIQDWDLDTWDRKIEAILKREPSTALLYLLKQFEDVSREHLECLTRKLHRPSLSPSEYERTKGSIEAVQSSITKTVISIDRIEDAVRKGAV